MALENKKNHLNAWKTVCMAKSQPRNNQSQCFHLSQDFLAITFKFKNYSFKIYIHIQMQYCRLDSIKKSEILFIWFEEWINLFMIWQVEVLIRQLHLIGMTSRYNYWRTVMKVFDSLNLIRLTTLLVKLWIKLSISQISQQDFWTRDMWMP